MFTYYLFDQKPKFYNDKLLDLLGKDRKKNEPILKRHKDIAAGMQASFEIIVLHQLDFLYKQTKCSNLCLAGGAAMNSVFNGKILGKTKFKKLYIPPFPDDTGVSIGAALYDYYNSNNEGKKRFSINHNYFGPEYSNDYIFNLLKRFKNKSKKSKNVEKRSSI